MRTKKKRTTTRKTMPKARCTLVNTYMSCIIVFLRLATLGSGHVGGQSRVDLTSQTRRRRRSHKLGFDGELGRSKAERCVRKRNVPSLATS